MPDIVTRAVAVKRYLERDAQPIATREMYDFWKSCSEAEKKQFGDFAAKALGLELSD